MTTWDSEKPKYGLTNPDEVYDVANTPPTWDDLCQIARFDMHVRQAVMLVERGDLTREQALLALAVSLAKSKNSLMRQQIQIINRTPMPPIRPVTRILSPTPVRTSDRVADMTLQEDE